jgi:transglutaminase-like putative cysteine protease
MNNKRFCANLRRLLVSCMVVSATVTAIAEPCLCEVPDWLRTAARETLPAYPPDTRAVILLEEQQTTVSKDGQINTVTRRAIKILRPDEKKHFGEFAVSFDPETRITWLKAWALPVNSKEFEAKEKDWVETSISEQTLYQDTRYKVIRLPYQEPGTIVAYECLQTQRPSILQDVWSPQTSIPVHRARYSLQLQPGWQYRQVWMNGGSHDPAADQNRFVWEMAELSPIEDEPSGPSMRAVALRLGLTFMPPSPGAGHAFTSWTDLALWHSQLSEESVKDSPEIQERVKQLTASAGSADDKMRALAGFVQKDIRYVAIEIGIGGYQPHPAPATFRNKYGDCKDKATLLVVMLRDAGIQAYPVVVHSSRGVVRPEFPSPYQFNHMIVAIRVPDGSTLAATDAAMDAEKLGRLLIFDPTSEYWPVGSLPDYLQDGQALLVAGAQSRLMRLPTAPPESSRLTRVGELKLATDGTVTGNINETYTGSYAAHLRDTLADMNRKEKGYLIEFILSQMQGSPTITHSEIVDQYEIAKPIVIRYEFRTRDFGKQIRDLMLVPLLTVRASGGTAIEWKDVSGAARKQPLEFEHSGVYSESDTMQLPAGFTVDEVPDALKLSNPALSYASRVENVGKELKYQREYRVINLTVPVTDLDKLRAVYREIRADEQRSAVLKKEP